MSEQSSPQLIKVVAAYQAGQSLTITGFASERGLELKLVDVDRAGGTTVTTGLFYPRTGVMSFGVQRMLNRIVHRSNVMVEAHDSLGGYTATGEHAAQRLERLAQIAYTFVRSEDGAAITKPENIIEVPEPVEETATDEAGNEWKKSGAGWTANGAGRGGRKAAEAQRKAEEDAEDEFWAKAQALVS